MNQRSLFAKATTQTPLEEKKKPTQVNTSRRSKKPEINQAICYDHIYCLMQQRRLQMMIHSCIYYEMGSSLITDSKFDEWGKELVKLQADYYDISKQVPWYEDFKGWDATTGFHLPTRHAWVVGKATALLESKGDK